jgi:hypothetical protein
MALCLTAGAVAATLAVQSFTLTWIHSVERTEIREDYRLVDDRLVLVTARIKGSGAGFDPPPGSKLEDGWWRYEPNLTLPAVTLARSAAVGDWRICLNRTCHSLEYYLPDADNSAPVQIAACTNGGQNR